MILMAEVEVFGGHVLQGVSANGFSRFRTYPVVISLVGKYKCQKYQNSSPVMGVRTIFIENVQVTLPYVPNSKSEAGVHFRGIREITAHFKNVPDAFTHMAPGKFRLTMIGHGHYYKLNQVEVPVTPALTSLLMHPQDSFLFIIHTVVLITNSYYYLKNKLSAF